MGKTKSYQAKCHGHNALYAYKKSNYTRFNPHSLPSAMVFNQLDLIYSNLTPISYPMAIACPSPIRSG